MLKLELSQPNSNILTIKKSSERIATMNFTILESFLMRVTNYNLQNRNSLNVNGNPELDEFNYDLNSLKKVL